VHFLDLPAISIDTSDDKEGEYNFVSFKETTRDVGIDHSCDIVDEDIKSLLQHIALFALLNGRVKQSLDVSE
jgi:hypothetical protein